MTAKRVVNSWLFVLGADKQQPRTNNQELNCPGSPTGRRHPAQNGSSVGSNPTQGTRRCGRTFLAQTPENLRQRVCPAHIEWRVWRNGSVTVFQTEGVGSSPATRTNKEDRQISVCCTALLTRFPAKSGMRVRAPCPPQSTTERCSVATRMKHDFGR